MGVRRVYAEKKEEFAVAAKALRHEFRHSLGFAGVTDVRILIRYDIENITDVTYQRALTTVFSEPPVDNLYEETFDAGEGRVFSAEYLPGQYDQRADSAEQCLKLLNEEEDCVIRSATTYVINGSFTEEEFAAMQQHCINPVDSRVASEEKPESLKQEFPEPEDVAVFEGFNTMPEEEFSALYASLSLAMTYRDFQHIRKYFTEEEQRDPTVTEIRVLDTYWSDHCRHTTFLTELTEVSIDNGFYSGPIQQAWYEYRSAFDALYRDRDDKYVCLMDIALMGMKKLKAMGKLKDQEETDEINACSIVVPVEVNGKTEEWLVNFKNETHNHPTEIEPFGGAATCLGGAIRDPLSGRTYVYQAMRITGAADPTVPVADTMPGKLPQKTLVRQAARGYSSYGNQIGLATGYVKEIYHPNYAAKRMEIGAVIGAAPRRAVKRLTSDPGDVIILLGGRTGRDGIGGATGSSKAHTTESLDVCGAEVQKGNAPTERKLQRLFRREEVSKLIKKCNDFGAGGVSVAIGELADGLAIDLDRVPKKYAGLDGTEIAISESQERMAVVIDKNNLKLFLSYVAEENLEATEVAVVTEEPRLKMTWRGKTIVDLSRAFLNTNGAHQEATARITIPQQEKNYFSEKRIGAFSELMRSTLSDLNVCSQKGLVEMFDGSIGAGSVLMPYGGKYQRTETQAMVAKLPVQRGDCNTVTMMSYGFDPYLSSWSPFHGAQYAVISSVAKIVAAGGNYHRIRFTFQEYFRRLKEDPERWGEPAVALLGAMHAQLKLGLPSIGGKDSMSGSFEDMDVPPTLVSFAVNIANEGDILTPEFKHPGDRLILIPLKRDAFDLPDYAETIARYDEVVELMEQKKVKAAYAVTGSGIAAAVAKMAFGNMLGVRFADDLTSFDLFAHSIGDLILEIGLEDLEAAMAIPGARDIGSVEQEAVFRLQGESISVAEAVQVWEERLDGVFHHVAEGTKEDVSRPLYEPETPYICKEKVAKPTVFIPVFPGTNCEYDSARAFEKAGANTIVSVMRNGNAAEIRESAEEFARQIKKSQIIMFPGGFSAGDEPEGSAKFFASAFRNARMKEAVEELLQKRDGLMLGICNGFQALIKLGLLPYGEIRPQEQDSPTLTYNTIGRHISHMVYTKVVSTKSPWLSHAKPGEVLVSPASHGEGRFVANEDWIEKLFANGQVAFQYSDFDGNVTMDPAWNVNGSYMAIEGITSEDGRILGKMAHTERRGRSVAINIYGDQDCEMFKSGVSYFQ